MCIDLGKRVGVTAPFSVSLKEQVRNSVAAIKANLNDEDSDKKIYLNDDLPPAG